VDRVRRCRRVRWAVPVAVLVAGLVAGLAACAPLTPDEDSWRVDARLAVSDVSSQVSTARLALEQDRQGHLLGGYLQTVAVEAETNAGASAEKFSALQPPRGEVSRHTGVSDELDRDTGLLTDVRIAVVAGDQDQYAGLVRQLASASDRLDALREQLEHGPSAAGRP
jgi:hypothetical protein